MAGRVWVIGVLLGCASLSACGAKTTVDPDDSPGSQLAGGEPGGQDSKTPTSPPGPGGKPRSPPGAGWLDDGTPLGDCVSGFVEAEDPERPCNCLVEGVCFDTKRDACACICPRTSTANTCVSKQDCERDSHTRVSCYAL
jgi:hypothetical protein